MKHYSTDSECGIKTIIRNTCRKYPKKFTTSLAKISFGLFNDTVLTVQTTCRRTADENIDEKLR